VLQLPPLTESDWHVQTGSSPPGLDMAQRCDWPGEQVQSPKRQPEFAA